jgi:hypothetical protein
LRVVRVPNPAAGSEVAISPNTGGLWIVRSLVATFTADATIANRDVTVVADDGTTVWFQTPGRTAVAAAGVATFVGHSGSVGSAGAAGIQVLDMPAGGLLLLPGYRLRTITTNLQAGDAFSAIVALVDDWPLGPSLRFRPVPGYVVEEA